MSTSLVAEADSAKEKTFRDFGARRFLLDTSKK